VLVQRRTRAQARSGARRWIDFSEDDGKSIANGADNKLGGKAAGLFDNAFHLHVAT
jgi:hypothetical protein